MKNINIAIAALALMGFGAMSCEDKLDVVNINQQTTDQFGTNLDEFEEVILAAYNHIRVEGTFSRVGYLADVVAGDEVNSYSDNDWWRPLDYNNPDFNNESASWPYRDWYYSINTCNYILSKIDDISGSEERKNILKGQALFIRSLAYYELTCYYQDVPLVTDYSVYETLETQYVETTSQKDILKQIEDDLIEAIKLLPSRDEGGQWAKGRATKGAAAGYLARTYMFHHQFDKALPILEKFINGEYGKYRLMEDYGDNCRSGAAYENNDESVFEIQFLDYGHQGVDEEWTPVNNSKNPTGAHAIESVFAGPAFGGWCDLGATPWLYHLFKSQKTEEEGTLDSRLYWTLCTYEPEYESMSGTANVVYGQDITAHCITNNVRGGIMIAKNTSARENLYKGVKQGLWCGVNLRLMRYSDVLLRAAECENEVNGPTQRAINWINEVRTRAGLVELELADFDTQDKLFEQIANVERPLEFGCEHGRRQDLIRWGFYYQDDRLNQIRQHACTNWDPANPTDIPSSIANAADDPLSNWKPGHEYFPIYNPYLQANYKLKGNSANNNTSNNSFYSGYTIHPVVDLSK